jgi:hypothetical protein
VQSAPDIWNVFPPARLTLSERRIWNELAIGFRGIGIARDGDDAAMFELLVMLTEKQRTDFDSMFSYEIGLHIYLIDKFQRTTPEKRAKSGFSKLAWRTLDRLLIKRGQKEQESTQDEAEAA